MTYDRAVMKLKPELIRSANLGIFTNLIAELGDKLGAADYIPVQTTNQQLYSNTVNRVIVSDAIVDQPAWRYTVKQPTSDWSQPDFDDSGWIEGVAGFGTTGTPGSIVNTLWKTSNIWLRRKIILQDTDLKNIELQLHHDDDVEVYLNGVLAFSQKSYLKNYGEFDINPEAQRALKSGINTLSAHCHQTRGGQFIDVGIIRAK
jgi:hypothetical protein